MNTGQDQPDTTMQNNTSSYRPGIIAFLITAVIGTGLLTAQLFYEYIEEIDNKGLHFPIYAWLIWYFALSLVPIALTAPALGLGLFAGRAHFAARERSQMFIKKFLLITVAISVLGFVYNGFVVSYANFKSVSMLYNMRNARNEQEYIKELNDTANKSMWGGTRKGSPWLLSITEILKERSELTTSFAKRKTDLIEAIKQTCDLRTIAAVIDTSRRARKYGLTMNAIGANATGGNDPGSANNIRALMDMYIMEGEMNETSINTFDTSITKQAFYPLTLLLWMIDGLLLGYAFRRVHMAVPILVFTLVLVWVPPLSDRVIDMIAHGEALSQLWARSAYLTLLAIPALFLFKVNKVTPGKEA